MNNTPTFSTVMQEHYGNSFEMQFIGMRYFLLGLLEHDNTVSVPLAQLEAAAPCLSTYKADGTLGEYQKRFAEAVAACDEVIERGAITTNGAIATLSANLGPLSSSKGAATPSLDDDELEEHDFSAVTSAYNKLHVSMQTFLMGLCVRQSRFKVSYDAFLFGGTVHTGVRKNGKTPEYQHQLEIAHLLRTMIRSMMHPAETLATAFLHDAPEDYDVSYEEMLQRFGLLVADATELLNKYDKDGQLKPKEQYYKAMGENPITSLVKPGDNGHNQSTMGGVMAMQKRFAYTMNIKKLSWKMLKDARRRFPQQEAAYENLKFILRIQYNAVQDMFQAIQFDPETGKGHPALNL